jgi:ribosomal protein L7/L12
LYPVLSHAAVASLLNGQVIEAIKQVRLEQNIGLNEAKDVIETFLRSQRLFRSESMKLMREKDCSAG